MGAELVTLDGCVRDRLHHAAHSSDARDQEPVRRGPPPASSGFADHQYREWRADRRGVRRRRHQARPRRRRRLMSRRGAATDQSLTGLRRSLRPPHIAASTVEAQRAGGPRDGVAVRDLRDGAIRKRRQLSRLPARSRSGCAVYDARRSPRCAARPDSSGRTHGVGIRYYGPAVNAGSDLLARPWWPGCSGRFSPGASRFIKRRAVAAQRRHRDRESRSSRARDFANLLSVKIHTSDGETLGGGNSLRTGQRALTAVDGVEIEVPPRGHAALIKNAEQPA